MSMEDVLVPRERHDAVVLIGVDRWENVEFIKVYAVSEEIAKKTLEEFFNARGLFPGDYRLVSRGHEEVGERKAITTKTEGSLSAALARLGLKLLSNGVLYLENIERLYQFTLVSETLYERIASETATKESRKVKIEGPVDELEALSLGLDAIVENLRGVELSEFLPENALLLREPPVERVVELLSGERDYPLIVETKDLKKYAPLDFPVVLRLPPLTVEEFTAELSQRLGFDVDSRHFLSYPPERLNLRNVEALAKLVRALMEKKGLSEKDALGLAVRLNLGEL
ncbi:hypothetical protein [Thermococcus sp. GR6]|uniref:hypothetical protein n=1 Tax=Thermococcus sp. GR6 TaxID=1638256 RepID=UPI00142FA05D|nr:hypothetical protein [Thermococcus sp. GR6]NJE42739.1 hypothetical protein [Thermococcus sp. GR6]